MKIEYRFNPALPIIKPGYRGNKVIGGKFANGEDLYEPQFSNVLRWKLFNSNPQAAEKKQDHWTPEVLQNPKLTEGNEDRIVWLGHSTLFICLNGVKLLTDPLLFDSFFLKRRHPLPCQPAALTGIDYLLMSHGHPDHFDPQSLQAIGKLNQGMECLVPLQMTRLLREQELAYKTQEAGWWQQYQNLKGNLRVTFLPAAHWYRRTLTDMNKVLWGSFLIQAGNKSVYFAGDTAMDMHFEEIRKLFPDIEVVCMPIGAYKPHWFMHRSHTSPEDAVKAFNQLGATTFLPIHYGTLDLADEPASEPLRKMHLLEAEGQLHGKLLPPAVGEVIPI